MSAEIVTAAKWQLTPERLQELQSQGAIVKADDTERQDGMELPPVSYGETVVGELTDQERDLFLELSDVHDTVEQRARECVAAHLRKASEELLDGSVQPPAMVGQQSPMVFQDDDEAKYFFKEQKRLAYLHSCFHFVLGERLGLHEFVLGVRAGWRVVKVKRRY